MLSDVSLHTLRYGLSTFDDIDISQDKNFIVGGSRGGRVIVWDLETGKILWNTWKHKEWVNGVAFSPDGSIIVSVAFDKINIWDVNEKKRLYKTKPPKKFLTAGQWAVRVAFGISNNFVVIGLSKGDIIILDIPTRQYLQKIVRVGRYVRDMCITSDGNRIIAAGNDGSVASVGFFDSHLHFHKKIFNKDILSLDCSADMKYIATSSKKAPLRVLDFSSGEIAFEIPMDKKKSFSTLAITPDSKYIIGKIDNLKKLKIHKLNTGELVEEINFPAKYVQCLKISSDGQFLAASSGNKILVLELKHYLD
ncbi:MAG: WD40 repeat domain-containing protein [Promethearchaeota archaeon]